MGGANMNYKIQQLKKMLAAEQAQPENQKYGAHLQHWAGTSKPINLDERAIQALIQHYKLRLNEGEE
jgi:hypothetical protein